VAHFCVIRNRQRKIGFDLAFIRDIAESALPACRAAARSPGSALAGLGGIETTIVGDREIARVHSQFFNDPAPTDVITFPHGEILIGAGVVAENAERFGCSSASEEAALCVIHGMLHLAGWDDQTAGDAKDMARKQEQIFKIARRMVCSRNL
jgi:probable rRNA maturation factor